MSKTIDEKVVEMRFDNKQFESNVQTSLSTIEKLKQSLNMDSAAKSFDSINTAAKGVNMSGLGDAVDTVRARFSTLEVMAVTALANITNSVVNTGKQMLSSLTIEPISQGFSEYELKMGSIQTIMMSTGASLEEVNGYLNELNTYADKTIYSFSDMTSNIGKFTNAGVKLEDAVMAIQGVSNAAAVSGANSNEASRAMYNFAQALSAGYVKLIDWKSIENANMATVEFKTQLLEAAVAAGTLTRTADGMYQTLEGNVIDATHNFNDSLQDQWMTTDVLVSTLRDYADETTEIGKKAFAAAQDVKTFTQLMDTLKEAVGSGWAQTFEILFGDFEEAKELWTSLSQTIGGFIDAQSKARNELLQGWKDLGGRTVLIEALKNAFEGLTSVVKPIVEAFKEIFPATTAQQLYNLTEGLKKFTEKLKLSDKASANLKSTFKGLFAILDIVKQAFSAIFTAIKPLFGGFDTLGGGILGVTGGIGNAIVKFDEFIKQNEVFTKVAEGIATVLKTVITALRTFVGKVKEKLDSVGFELFHSLLERIHERMSQIGEAAGSMKSGVVTAVEAMGEALANCKFLQLLQAIWNAVKSIAGGIAKGLGTAIDGLISSLSNANFSGIIDLLNGLSVGGIALGITKFLKSVSEPFKGLEGLLENVTGILDGVRGCFEAYQTQLKAGTLLKIAAAIAVLAASIVAISLIDSDKLAAALAAITALFADLMVAMAVFSKISGNMKGVAKSSAAMLAMSTSVLLLASALKKVADLDVKQLAIGLTGVAGLTAIVVAAAKAMSSNTKTVMKGATSMVIFAAAIKVLASACKDLSELSWDQLARGLVGVGVLMTEISLFLKTAKFSGKTITTATGIVILAAAIKVLASACEDFANMEWGELAKGLTSIGVLLAEITAFTKLTGNAQHVISTGLALIEIAAAMKIFASALSDFGSMQWDEIGRGLTAMAGALAEVTIALNFMPSNMVSTGTGLVIVAAALEVLADALGKMGNFSWEQIVKGLVVMGGALAELAVGLNFMKGTLSGSAAMLVAAAALAVLTPVLSVLGAMSWSSIAKGLVALAGAFTVIGVAGAVLTPLVPAILGLSGAFALIGVAVLGIGAGLLAAGTGLSALAVGLTALAAAGTAGATAIVASLTVIITGVAGLIPAVVAKIGEGIIEFCRVIAESAPAIGEAIKAVVLTLVDVLVECVPAIAEGALQLVVGVLDALVQYTPHIVDSIFQFLIGVLEGIARNLPGLIQAAIDVLMSFFSGIVDALKGIDIETLLQGIVGIGLLAAIMAALSAVASLVPGAMVGVLGMGVVIAELALVLAAIGALAQIPGLQWLINEGGNLLQGIGTAIGKFIGGIVGGFMSGVSSQFPQIGSDLSAFMTNVQPFLDGASAIDPSIMDGVKALAETILILTAADILQGLTSWLTGGSSLSGFAEELVPFGQAMKDFSIAIAGMDGKLVANAATAGKTLAEMAATLPNSGGVVGFFTGENDMSEFGKQLVPFGEAMMGFASAVKGLDADAVVNASTAGKAMAEMASTIPNSGGVVGFFAGENDMKDFGEQLIPFGEAMKGFSDAVRGLDANVIIESATAGKALVELADTIPNSGGVVGFFADENDIDTFGERLIPFGKAMKAYSDAISGIDAEAVINSATAGQAIVELANTLPNSGGVVSWFTGDNDIGAFGESLVSFGENFAQYAAYMKDVDTGILAATTTAASSIVELQKSLPKEGGWFSDDMSLSDFGSDMSSFGQYFSNYYSYISGVNATQLAAVIAEMNKLVNMAKGMVGLDTSGMSNFAQSLTQLGNSGIEGFISAFTNANARVTQAATNMLTTFINGANAQKANVTNTFTMLVTGIITTLTAKQSQFTTIGSTMMTNFVSGVLSKDSTVRSTFTQIVNGCLTAIRNKFQEFNTVGQTIMTNFIAGVRNKDTLAKEAFVQIVSGCLTAIRDKYDDFYTAGKYLVEGFADGITAYTYLAEARAKAMARAAAKAAEAELDINSPSKVGERIGGYFGMGFVNMIEAYADNSYKAGANIASAAKEGLSNAVSKIRNFIDGDMDTQPTIRPVLDLSEVQSSAGKLSAILSRTQALKISASMNNETGANQNGDETAPAAGNSYNFVQNNYSPKALSRIDIYRQTKNQFSALKGLVET